MTTLITLLLSLSLCTTGTLSQYSERPTLEVIANRSVVGRAAYTLPDNWREYDGLIAVKDCADLGNVYHIYWQGHYARVLAFDCSGHASTKAWMTRNGVLGELDFYTARRWNMLGKGMRGALMCRELWR